MVEGSRIQGVQGSSETNQTINEGWEQEGRWGYDTTNELF